MGDTVGVYNVNILHSIILYMVCGNLCVQLTDESARAKAETMKNEPSWKFSSLQSASETLRDSLKSKSKEK